MKNKHCFLACSLTWSLSHAQLALIQPRPTCLRILPPLVKKPSQNIITLPLTDIATSHSDEGTPSIEVPYYVCSSEMLRTEDNYDMETIINEEIVKTQNQCANHINYRSPCHHKTEVELWLSQGKMERAPGLEQGRIQWNEEFRGFAALV